MKSFFYSIFCFCSKLEKNGSANVEKMIQLADQAKNIGAFVVANKIFADLLLVKLLKLPGARGISLWIEEDQHDPTIAGRKSDVGQRYYDLLVIKTTKGGYLNIPIPLLFPEVLVSLLKRGGVNFEPKLEHNREINSSSDQEKRSLEDSRLEIEELMGIPHLDVIDIITEDGMLSSEVDR